MGYVPLDDLLREHGGQVNPATLRSDAAQYLDLLLETTLKPFIEPIIIPSPSSVGTRNSARPPVARIIFLDRWDIAAYAALADETPVVLLSAGLPFAFHEFFSTLLATPHVYKSIDSQDEQPEFDKPPRNYLHLRDASASEEPSVALFSVPFGRQPISSTRQSLATDMAHTALMFLLLHEIGHVTHGHLELINQLDGTSTLTELMSDSSDPSSQRTQNEGWYFEFQADVAAAIQAIQPHLPGKVTRYETRRPRATNRYRDFLFSLGVMFLALGYTDGSLLRAPRKRKRTSTHPPLIGRMHFALWNVQNLFERAGIAKEQVRLLASKAYEDLYAAANLLGVNQHWTASFTQPEPYTSQALQTLSQNDRLAERLEDCCRTVSQHYYRHGNKVSREEYQSEQPADSFGLRGQAVEHLVNGEWVPIEFPHESDGPDAFVDAARKWVRVGMIDAALIYLQTALKRAPTHSAAVQLRDRLLAQLGDHRQYVERFLENPHVDSHFADLILESIDLSDPGSALPKLDCVISLRPRQAGPLAERARAQSLRAEWQLALEDSTAAIAMGLEAERESVAWVDRGNALVELHQFDEGLDAFNRALDINSHSVHALVNRGIALQRHGRSLDALVDLERVLQLAPDHAEHYFLCAAALRGTGQLEAAIRRTTQAIKRDTNNPKYYAARAQAHRENEDLEAALADLDTAIALEPHNPIHRMEKVTALISLGRKSEAEIEWDVIKSNPEWVNQLSTIYLEQDVSN